MATNDQYSGPGANEMFCSFCGKTRSQVSKLIAGPGGVYICDECVHACSEMIDEVENAGIEEVILDLTRRGDLTVLLVEIDVGTGVHAVTGPDLVVVAPPVPVPVGDVPAELGVPAPSDDSGDVIGELPVGQHRPALGVGETGQFSTSEGSRAAGVPEGSSGSRRR